VKNEKVLCRVKNETNMLYTRRKATWTGHILCRNCLLKQVIEGDRGKDRLRGTRGRRRKHLKDDSKEKIGYWKFKENEPDHALWKTRFERRYGLVVRHTTEWAILSWANPNFGTGGGGKTSSLKRKEMENMI
jgi:hypothetical protein